MLRFENIYRETKYLDDLFLQQYAIKSPDIIRKYKLELLVEFGELANETRCFKFWSKKQKGEEEKVLEEYIDCLFMALYFSNITGITLDEEFPPSLNGDVIDTFISLHKFASAISETPTKDEVKRVLVELDHLAKLLDFTIEDLERVTIKKEKIILDRFNTEY